MLKVHENATYALRELDGTHLKVPIAGKRVKIFRRREGFQDLHEIFEPEAGLTHPYNQDWEEDNDDDDQALQSD